MLNGAKGTLSLAKEKKGSSCFIDKDEPFLNGLGKGHETKNTILQVKTA
ncbi:MAG TPA: hypothetical protein VJ558_09170 [Bacillales bacterium]|nr:hypothetical protein [Bacillales bacterium]